MNTTIIQSTRCGYKITGLRALYWETCRSGEWVKGNRPWTFSNQTRLDSPLCVILFASELCLSVTMLCCSAGFVTRMKIEQCINLKFLVKLKKKTLTECFQLLKEVYNDNVMSHNASFWMAQTVHGRSGGGGKQQTSGTPFNIKNQRKCWENQWNCWPEGQQLIKKYYLEVLTKFWERVRKQMPDCGRRNHGFCIKTVRQLTTPSRWSSF
jgi:hypothetical protein